MSSLIQGAACTMLRSARASQFHGLTFQKKKKNDWCIHRVAMGGASTRLVLSMLESCRVYYL